MDIRDFQLHIDKMYSAKDRARGASATFLWLAEEIGELASAIAEGDRAQQQEEFADVLAWLFTLANVQNVDLTEAIQNKYAAGCPGCKKLVCSCDAKG